MKFIAVAVLAVTVGLFAGLQFAGWVVARQFHHEASSLGNAQRVLVGVSLRALDELEAGRVDQAKCFLAGQVAVYYRTIQRTFDFMNQFCTFATLALANGGLSISR